MQDPSPKEFSRISVMRNDRVSITSPQVPSPHILLPTGTPSRILHPMPSSLTLDQLGWSTHPRPMRVQELQQSIPHHVGAKFSRYERSTVPPRKDILCRCELVQSAGPKFSDPSASQVLGYGVSNAVTGGKAIVKPTRIGVMIDRVHVRDEILQEFGNDHQHHTKPNFTHR